MTRPPSAPALPIVVDQLYKSFRVTRRDPGLRAAVRALWSPHHTIVEAVRGVSFQVAPGERVGFLGPNGAGKTTTLKMLSGLLHPTSGTVQVGSWIPRDRRPGFLRAITLVMGQKQQLLWDLPAADTFALNRALYEVPRDQGDALERELVELLGVGDFLHKPVRTLSLGERMKCELIAALLHQPRVLFLDEPTIGLDVAMQAQVRRFVKEYNERTGATVLLTSHHMDDVLALCPRVVVIDRGQVRFDGALGALVRSVAPARRVQLTLRRPVELADAQTFGAVVSLEAERLVLDVPPDEVAQRLAGMMTRLPVLDVEVRDPPLEDVLTRLFGSSDTAA